LKRKALYILLFIFIFLIFVGLILFPIAAKNKKVQNWLTDKTTAYLSSKLDAKIDIGEVELIFFDSFKINDLTIVDNTNTELIKLKEANVDISFFSLGLKKINIDEIVLDDYSINLVKEIDGAEYNIEKIINQLINGADDTDKEEEENDAAADDNSQSWKVSFNKVLLNKGHLIVNDKKGGLLVDVAVEEISAILEEVSPKLMFSNTTLKRPIILVEQNVSYNQSTDDVPDLSFIDTDFFLHISNLTVKDGAIQYINRTANTNLIKTKFNENNIQLNHLTGSIGNFQLLDDTLKLTETKLSFIERSGLEVQQLETSFVMQPKLILFDKLNLKLPNTYFKSKLALNFNNTDAFSDFENKVQLTSNLTNTYFNLQSISPFIPAESLVTLNKNFLTEKINANGIIKGTVNHLRSNQLQLAIGETQKFNGDIVLKNIVDIENAQLFSDSIIVESNLNYINENIAKLPKQVVAFNEAKYIGSLNGGLDSLLINGNLNTIYGLANVNMLLQLKDEPAYVGTLSVADFNLQPFLPDEKQKIEQVTATIEVNGKGATINTINTLLKAYITKVNYNNELYEKIAFDGTLDQKKFTGSLISDANNLNVEATGYIDLLNDDPKIKLKTTINEVDLQALKLTKQSFIIKAKTDLDFDGKDIDEITGDFTIDDLTIITDNKTYNIGNVNIKSTKNTSDEKLITLQSTPLQATVEGKFSFKDIHLVFQKIIKNYISYTIWEEPNLTNNSYGRFDITISDTILLKQYTENSFALNGITKIAGNFDSKNNSIDLNIENPQFAIDNNSFNGIKLKAITDGEVLKITSSIDTLYTIDSIKITNINLNGIVKEDIFDFNLKTADNTIPNRINLNGQLAVAFDTLNLNLGVSKIFINNQLWEANSGIIKFAAPAYLYVESFSLAQKFQSVFIQNLPEADGKSTTTIKAKSLNLADLAALAGPDKLKLRGLVNGNIVVKDLFQLPAIEGLFTIDDFYYQNTFLGDFKFDAEKTPGTEKVFTKIELLDTLNKVSGTGILDYGVKPPQLQFDFNIDTLSIAILQDIIGDNIADTQGIITGNGTVTGAINNPKFEAELTVIDVATTVQYLKCRYYVNNQNFKVSNQKIIFDSFILNDEQDNYAELIGLLDLSDLNKIYTELMVFTPKFQFLNTKKKDNNYFYGDAFADGNLYIEGYLDDISFDITATSLPGTQIYLPLEYDYAEGEDQFYTFVNTTIDSTITKKENYEIDLSKFKFSGIFDITDDAEIQIIFDQQAGDIIRSRGNGEIFMDVNEFGEFSMLGNYNITEGDYLFTFQNIINKKFKVAPGGTISWSGDPLNAQIDINAIYEKRVSPYPLIQGLGLPESDEAEAKSPVPSKLNLNLRGALSTPEIDLSIELEKNGVGNFMIDSRINEINNDEAELNKQVIGLLLLNKFLPIDETITALADSPLQSGVNTLSEYVSNQLSIYLSDALSNLFDDVNVSYQNYGLENSETEDLLNEFELGLGKRFLDNRLYINVGGNLQVGNTVSSQNALKEKNINTFFGGDFLIEYTLTEAGQLKVKAYRQNDYDIIQRYNKTGIGLSYQTSFKEYSDIFKFKK